MLRWLFNDSLIGGPRIFRVVTSVFSVRFIVIYSHDQVGQVMIGLFDFEEVDHMASSRSSFAVFGPLAKILDPSDAIDQRRFTIHFRRHFRSFLWALPSHGPPMEPLIEKFDEVFSDHLRRFFLNEVACRWNGVKCRTRWSIVRSVPSRWESTRLPVPKGSASGRRFRRTGVPPPQCTAGCSV